MKVVASRAEFRQARTVLDGTVGLVPTMGALHDGHAALLRAARADCDQVVATIFVNPLQFGAAEDLARYPRSLDADLARCEQIGVDLVWTPGVDDVYAETGAAVTVAPGPLGSVLEGAARPGHFAGVLTVVAKFLHLVRPDRAYFGEKDYQQLLLVTRMVGDLDFDTTVIGVPTVRADDGLALSSRNVLLAPDERLLAVALSRALAAGGSVSSHGCAAVLAAATAELAAAAGVTVDYLALRGPDLGEVPAHGPARLLVAAAVGRTRLIDNVAVVL